MGIPDLFQHCYGIGDKWLRFLQPLTEQSLLAGDQSIPIGFLQVKLKSFPQSHFVGNSYEVLLVCRPIELNPKGFQGLVPGAVMDTLGIGQHAVEIEEQRVVFGAVVRGH